MSLDPQAQKLLDNVAALGLPPVYKLPVEEARKRMNAVFITTTDKENVYKIHAIQVPGPIGDLPIRLYRPKQADGLPVLVFYHGGGWVLNSVETHDDLCRSIANDVGCIVASVDYRLAPEHQFPAAIDDAHTAFQWVIQNAYKFGGDPSKVAVGGDSSGGTQAAVVSLLARDRGGPPIKFQWLAYPPLDHYSRGTASYTEMGKGYSLDRDFMIWFWDNYLPKGTDLNNPYICPLRAIDCKDLPPTLIISAYFDPLRDEAYLYVNKLKESGVNVVFHCYEDQMHGFLMQRKNIAKAAAIFKETAKVLRTYFNE